MTEKIYNWQTTKRYNDYTSYMKSLFKTRVQKISINAGFTCPNRDGTISEGGCTYCNNNTFSPFYCKPEKTIKEQLNEGISFFAKKYQTQKYLAYFQSYTNTYNTLDELQKKYTQALMHKQVIGLVIATRPDCINDELLNLLKNISKEYYVMLEYGVESTYDKTLKRINRGHTFAQAEEAIIKTAEKKINVGAHFIIGLPGESKYQIIETAKTISNLPLKTIKLHQLQIIKGTNMAQEFLAFPENFNLPNADDYIELIAEFLENLSPDIIVERFISESPSELLIAPKWGRLKNFEIVAKIEKKLKEMDTYQGRKKDEI